MSDKLTKDPTHARVFTAYWCKPIPFLCEYPRDFVKIVEGFDDSEVLRQATFLKDDFEARWYGVVIGDALRLR